MDVTLSPVMNLAVAKQRLKEFQAFVADYLREGEDFEPSPERRNRPSTSLEPTNCANSTALPMITTSWTRLRTSTKGSSTTTSNTP